MAAFKMTIGDPKTGKTVQKEVKDQEAESLIGKKITDTFEGDGVGLAGYSFEITGGSDDSGVPMRRDVQGTARKKILVVSGVGARKRGKGIRQRKMVAGNTVHAKTAQINLKVLKMGKEDIFAGAKEAKKAVKEAKPEAKEAKQPAPKPEAKEDKRPEPKHQAKLAKEEKAS